MEEKFGFRTMAGGGPPALRGQEEKERVLGSSRPSSFSFHIHKFLNIKQEELVEDEVQEYKVDTNLYTKLKNLAWSQTVFLQFTFCRKRRLMKPLILSSVAICIHNTVFFLHV